jgi:hypothetical protein
MAKVILFGGGDGGGIRITLKGVEPIPPFDPSIRHQLRALNQLALAGRLLPEKASGRSLGGIIGKLTGLVLTQLEGLLGEIDADNGLIYQDDDGGFTCGSTGKPPIPFPFPVDPRRTVQELLSRGVINAQTLTFLEQAARQKLDVIAVARDPQAAAEKIGISLAPEVEQCIKSLKLDTPQIEDKTDQAVIEFYRKVVADGRFLSEWAINPETVASRLKLSVPRDVFERITATRDFALIRPLGPGAVMCPAAVAVAIAIVIVLWDREANLPVIDRSGLTKL